MNHALNIYHRLPPTARSAVASLRGYYLTWWRYDKHTAKLVDEALERDSWSEQQWTDWRSSRLEHLLERAARKVPFYREQWQRRRRRGDRASWSYLENWPILEKESLRSNPLSFVADDCRLSKMFREHTSGTTGTSLDLWFSRESVRQWYALFEARCRHWYGLTRRDRWAILGGQLVTPAKQKNPPFWVWNAGLNQLYLSSYHLAPNSIPAYLDALAKYRIKYILGYPSAIYTLASEAVRLKRDDLKMEVAIANAEPLYDFQCEMISSAFDCPVRETYGMAEMAAAASECGHGSLHQWPDTGIIEAYHESGSEIADFICTGLINSDMPLIRYRVGDGGKLSDRSCTCGRQLPLIDKIEGRSDDLLYTVDGRRVGRMDPVFKGGLPIREAQIIQTTLRSVTVRYVPAQDARDDAVSILTERIRDRMGDISVVFEAVSEIARTDRGKFRAVICQVSPDERMSINNSSRRPTPEGRPA